MAGSGAASIPQPDIAAEAVATCIPLCVIAGMLQSRQAGAPAQLSSSRTASNAKSILTRTNAMIRGSEAERVRKVFTR